MPMPMAWLQLFVMINMLVLFTDFQYKQMVCAIPGHSQPVLAATVARGVEQSKPRAQSA